MGRFDERYTEQQREAVGRAMLDPHPITGKRVTAQQAVTMLNRGELAVDPPPEPMPVTTAYWCRNRERAKRQGNTLSPAAKQALEDPTGVAERLTQQILSIHERNIEELTAQRAKRTPDPRLFAMVVKNHREILAAIRPPGRQTRVAPKGAPIKPPDPEDVVASLAKAHAASSRGAPSPTVS